MRRAHLFLALVSLEVSVASPGCFLEDYERKDVIYGSATLTWSISGRSDPDVCGAHGASFVRIVVRHEDGTVVASDDRACAASGARYVLRRGWYEASLTLLDASLDAISGARGTGRFFVAAGRDTFVTTDFVAVQGPPGTQPAPAVAAGASR